MESLLDYMQRLMKRFSEIQIDYRLQESNGRKRAEGLNKRVLWWSMAQTLAIVAISMGQVFVLKNFFK